MEKAGGATRRNLSLAILFAAAGLWTLSPFAARAGSEEDAVLAANDEFYRAFRERDMLAMAAVWGRQEPIVVVHPGWPRLEGREAVLESWRRILSNPNSPRIRITAARVSFKEGKAIVRCTEQVGDGLIEAINVFKHQDGAWKIILHGAAAVLSKRT